MEKIFLTHPDIDPLDDIESKIKSIKRINKLDCSEGGRREFSICGGAASIVVLASGLEDACTGSNNNPASLVLQLKYINKKVLFVGDFEDEEAVNTVIKCDIKSDALCLAHHGSRENHANSDEFLAAVNADIAIVSSDPLHENFKHPNSKLLIGIMQTRKKLHHTQLYMLETMMVK